MTPYYQDDAVTIYHGDCREVVPTLKGDAAITSPPYNLNTRINMKREYVSRQVLPDEFSTKYGSYADNLSPQDYYALTADVLTKCLEVAGMVFWNIQLATGNKASVAQLLGAFAANLKEVAVWDKGHGEPAMKERTMNGAAELVLVFDTADPATRQFGEATFERGTMDNIWRIKRPPPVKGHKATFPAALVNQCMTLCDAQTVIDPFMGSGTTLRAAKDMGRKAIGVEIDERYCEIAAKRMAQGVLDFGTANATGQGREAYPAPDCSQGGCDA